MRGRPNSFAAVKGALAAAAALALSGSVVACSGEAGAGDAAASRQEARTATRAESRAERGTEAADREAASGLATAEFAVEGMTCGGCALATEMAVKELDGVASADAEYDEATGEGRCTVEYDPDRVDPEQMMAAIREAGFRPSLEEGKAP